MTVELVVLAFCAVLIVIAWRVTVSWDVVRRVLAYARPECCICARRASWWTAWRDGWQSVPSYPLERCWGPEPEQGEGGLTSPWLCRECYDAGERAESLLLPEGLTP